MSKKTDKAPRGPLALRWRIGIAAAAAVLFAAAYRIWPAYFYTVSAEGVRSYQMPYAPTALLLEVIILAGILIPWRPSKKAGWVISLAVLLGMAFADHFVAEIALNTGYDVFHAKRFMFLMNPWLYGMIELLILMLTLNIRIAVVFGSCFTAFVTAANIYLMLWRGIPIYLTDLVDLQTAGDVAGNYHLTMTSGIFLLLLFVAAVIVLTQHIWPARTSYISKKRWLWRLILIPLCSGIIGGTVYYVVWTKGPKTHGTAMSSFRPIKSYIANGQMLTLLRSGNFLLVEKPDNYSEEAITDLNEQYVSETADSVEAEDVPNIIVIMNEALSDLQSVGSFETNEDPLQFIHSLSENAVTGDLYVSVFGGHTANTEYEVLTGDSYALCPSGTPYVLYIKSAMDSMASYMTSLGSGINIAMHPYTATNYNRANVYSSFGFDTFLSIADFADAQQVRNHVSDQADFERIIEEYENLRTTSDAPFYLFNVTMQNHSPYDTDYDTLPDTIKITSDGVEDQEEAERYLNLVRLSDDAFAELVSYFEDVDDKTIIVMFGDHQPALSDDFYNSITEQTRKQMSDEEEMIFYKTPLVIWANYDIEEEEGIEISANYLQTKIKAIAGLPLTGYDQFLQEMSEQIPIFTQNGYFDAEGNFYKVKSTKSPYWDLVSDYWNLVYQHLFKSGSGTQLFSLSQTQSAEAAEEETVRAAA